MNYWGGANTDPCAKHVACGELGGSRVAPLKKKPALKALFVAAASDYTLHQLLYSYRVYPGGDHP